MPLVYLGTGWFIGIAVASALHLPMEFLLPAFLVPIGGLILWENDRRTRLIWISLIFAICGRGDAGVQGELHRFGAAPVEGTTLGRWLRRW